jgi:signal transduction histidine kinase
MTRSRRLSLRARMLILLITVTAVFLLVMGAATAIVLNKRVGGQISADLRNELLHTPQQLAEHPGDYVVAVVAPVTGDVVLLSQGQLSQSFQQALEQLTYLQYLSYYRHQPFSITLSGGEKLNGVARPVSQAAVQLAGVTPPPNKRLLLVVARPPDVVTSQVSGVVITELITGGALLALLAIGGSWLIGRGLHPLDEMASTANEITSRGDLTARVAGADQSTEVGRLGSAINTMLDRIQQAFGARLRSEQKVREFAADASHELRTPLTTIRGYAELYRQGALGPDQLPNAMRRIEQEARRMSTLVAELLELARLDRTSSLDLAETDLAGLVRDAVADAAAVEPGRPVRAEAPPRLVAVVDEARIRQVLANLLANVRAHTPANAPVVVRLAAVTGAAAWTPAWSSVAAGGGAGAGTAARAGPAAGGPGPGTAARTVPLRPATWVLLEVADAGPGMSPDDAARAFDRFHRGTEPADGAGQREASGYWDENDGGYGNGTDHPDASDSAGGHGSGLGLSIVQAIAHAHGGQATLESWPGHGTRVRIWLPARPAS